MLSFIILLTVLLPVVFGYEWIATLRDQDEFERVKYVCSQNRVFASMSDIVSIDQQTHSYMYFDCDDDVIANKLSDMTIERDELVFADYSWGIDRIDQESLPLDKKFSTKFTGKGVNIYIIDTGVESRHKEFKGRYTHGKDFVNENNSHDDEHGHGTHCAGTAAGSSYGVARDAHIIGVKVLSKGGSGSMSNVMNGISWAVQNQKNKFGNTPAVISMSLGGGSHTALKNLVKDAAKRHIVVVAAGNQNTDACTKSPAQAGGNGMGNSVITVMSSTSSDKRSSFSNYGKCTDIVAPGSSITSAWIRNGERTISGTSMATPHVAGAAATFLQKHGYNKVFAQKDLMNSAIKDKIKDIPKNNRFLQLSAYTGPPTYAPTPFPTHVPPDICTDDQFCPQFWVSQFGAPIPTQNVLVTELVTVHPNDDIQACSKLTPKSLVGKTVLVKRGECTFYEKTQHARKAGAKAVIFYNHYHTAGFEPVYYGTPKNKDVFSALVTKKDGDELLKKVNQMIAIGRQDMYDRPTSSPTTFSCSNLVRSGCRVNAKCAWKRKQCNTIRVDDMGGQQFNFRLAHKACKKQNMHLCKSEIISDSDDWTWANEKCARSSYVQVKNGDKQCKHVTSVSRVKCCYLKF